MDGCLACDLAAGRAPLPGGRIHETTHWLVEHCIGPLGVGTLIVKPKRHVVHVWELDPDETGELGPLLKRTAQAVAELTVPEQVYVSLWSHMHAVPGHIHFVVQPVTRALMEEHDGRYGTGLQVEMFDRNVTPPESEVEAMSSRLRGWFDD